MKTQPVEAKTVIIKETGGLPHGRTCCAWFVREPNGKLTGQFHSEADAIQFAMGRATLAFMQAGRPLDAQAIKETISFESDTAYTPGTPKGAP